MRGALREQIQNAINRALQNSLGTTGDSQAAYINVGGRRRNRKKKKNKNKKSNGVNGSAWSALFLQQDEPPARSQLDIPPRSKGSPTVTKAKKACKEIKDEIKNRLSPPRSRKQSEDLEDKPLINEDADGEGDDDRAEDQENADPSKMPLPKWMRTTKAKKGKKDVDGADNASLNSEDITTAEAKTANGAPPAPSDDVTNAESQAKVAGEAEAKELVKAGEAPSSAEAKTSTAGSGDSASVTFTKGSQGVTVKAGDDAKTATADVKPGQLPPERDEEREKESLLHDPPTDGMVCCTIL